MAYFNEAYIDEYEILQEMNFSKKDLQDPATIDKILKRKGQFKSVLKFSNYLMMAITIIGDIVLSNAFNRQLGLKDKGFPNKSTSLLLGQLEFILSRKIGKSVKALPEKQYRKNIDKYKSQVKSLISKMEKAKAKDPDNADKYQKVIDNCNNVLADFDRRKAKAEKEKFDEMVQNLKEKYECLCNWKNHTPQIGHTGNGNDFGMFTIAKEYGIPEQDIINYAIKHEKKWACKDFQDTVVGPYANFDAVKDFNNSDIVWFSSDDEYSTFIVCNNKKFYYTDCSKYGIDSIYEEAYRLLDIPEDVLIEFDKEMGFYKFSDCPENVERKEFISFKD